MALRKPVQQSDGIVTNYHRILYTNSMINHHDSIAVVSYVDEDSRRLETSGIRPYQIAVTYEKPYTPDMTVAQAYQYLKTLPEFEGAEDILEDTETT